jgi:isopropylmalate/homocitrate/citramalate synthase
MLPFTPELVGQDPVEIVLGKLSGSETIEYYLEKTGTRLDRQGVREMVELVKSTAIAEQRELTQDDFVKLVQGVHSVA